MKEKGKEYESTLRELGVGCIFSTRYPNSYEETLKKAFLSHIGKDRLPAGTPAIITDLVEEMKDIHTSQWHEECHYAAVRRILGRIPRNKKDFKKGERLLKEAEKAAAEKAAREKALEKVFLGALSSCSYREAQGRWAGGDHTVNFLVGSEVRCSGCSHRVWSDNGKWSGLDSFVSFSVLPSWKEDVFEKGIATVLGEMVLDAQCMESGNGWDLFFCSIAHQSKGFALVKKDGFILKTGENIEFFTSEKTARKSLKAFLAEEARKNTLAKGWAEEAEEILFDC